jgi:hypothetical protein
MTRDDADSNWDEPDITDATDRNLITDISETFAFLSTESREARRKQKLREELVRAHFEQQIRAPSMLRSLINKLTRSP